MWAELTRNVWAGIHKETQEYHVVENGTTIRVKICPKYEITLLVGFKKQIPSAIFNTNKLNMTFHLCHNLNVQYQGTVFKQF